MSLQNRVRPTGEIVRTPARGTFMGNRGILHGPDRELGSARWKHKAWVCCRLDFKGRRRNIMAPGRYTELFFLDEAVAIAAGHRPCGECRREDHVLWREAWAKATGRTPDSKSMNAELHAHRVSRNRAQIRYAADLDALPDGAFVLIGDWPYLVHGNVLLRFEDSGYGEALLRPSGEVTVLTPRPALEVLRNGYRPHFHPSVAHEEKAT